MSAMKSRRRTAIAVLALASAIAIGPTEASGAPTLTFKVRALPIPGFPGTGDRLGTGAMLRGEAKLSGTEYSGSPAPITSIQFQMPAGTTLHPQGFATCSPSVLEQSGPQACPKTSLAGPGGYALGAVSFGGERVPERASIEVFFGPGGTMTAFVDGTTPTLIEELVPVDVTHASPPYGQTFNGNVPLIETVPEAPDASFLEGAISDGAAYKRDGKTIAYLTLPKTCPDGGWPTRGQVRLLGGATAEATYTMPCPPRARRGGPSDG
jgi:hypothetical protein